MQEDNRIASLFLVQPSS